MAKLRFVLLLGAALIACAQAQEDDCKCITPPPNVPIGGCETTENERTVIINTDNKTLCESYVECCWNDAVTKCLNYEKPSEQDKRKIRKPQNRARFGNLRQPPPICTLVPKPFPADCKYSNPQPYVLDPPLDIPYCVRIPCSLDRAEQKNLDKSQYECGIRPGCYFDKELFEYRTDFGPAVLAGVPVCHLAIRSAVFLREAQNAIETAGSWNPYYTKCLLDTFDEEIRKQPEGCKLINILKVFRILPKLAGWSGITSYECILIDGCWRKNEGCFYPVDVDRIVVKSNQRFTFNRFEVTYGRPKCQHFNDDNAYELLKSYHQCLAAGCSVDANVAAKYYYYLFEIGKQMETKDHWEYWGQVKRGKIGSGNIVEGIYWDFNFGKPPPSPGPNTSSWPPPTDSTGSPGSPGPPWTPPTEPALFASPPGPFRRHGGGVFAPPGNPQPVRDIKDFWPAEDTRCGDIYRPQGYRPCAPKTPPSYKSSDWCPYKPFRVPRFKPLKGSFQGCCDINPCYLSRRDIRKMHSGPSFYYTEWTAFSFCSETCGPGIQKRSRQCVTHDESLCTEPTEETRPCFDKPCGIWDNWSAWSPPCFERFTLRTRSRSCIPPGAVCGINQETLEEETRYCG